MKSCCRHFFITTVFMHSYLSTGAKKQPATSEETQVGFYFLMWVAFFKDQQLFHHSLIPF